MSASVDQFVSVGVDYLTCTFEGKKVAKQGANKAFDLLEQEMAAGNLRRPWSMSGFTGWKAGAVQVGCRGDEVLVRLSSHAAHSSWREFGVLASNCSRIDYQVTTRNDDAPSKRIRRHWRQAKRYRQQGHSSAAVGAYFGDCQTPTIYLGRRVSDRFGRIYDKELESPEEPWQGCVRYEVEYKNRAANLMLHTLLDHSSPNDCIAANCFQMFHDRGIHLTWFLQGVGNYSCIRKRDDISGRLEWLHTQVKPTVKLLLDLGLGPELEKALGISVDALGKINLHGPTRENWAERRAS